ncbi:NERD domain-containing protein [Arthrobacter sp. PAMC25564]|uniref:nuclease-related domain-containing protein n=1 Tax=Arthrobacter sp. PAMC25564 TaxID=2565366 RepID=UPI0010A20141|nr:nuclease-related domain-containing protein [Arthrobacter sp. PAMC25564]QCB98623.1 NERD domain-containing protein [Arthrobacter sp. PAMC25564]
MAAGDRAAEQSRLAAERVARLRRELEQAERHSQAWSAGAAGEATVAAKMSELAASGWLDLHDVHWPGRPKANLDHILVGPGGIIVVDAKNWSGNVQISDGRLRQNGYRRDREVLGASQQSAAVAALLEPQHRRLTQGWICLVAQPAVDETTESGVRILGLDALCPAAAHLPHVLDATEVQVIHAHLNEQLTGPASPPLLTTAEFAGADAPAAALQQWRPRPRAEANLGTPLRQPRRQSRRPSCLRALVQLALLFVGASLLMNFAASYRPAAPPTPGPAPTVSQTIQTIPAR